MSFYDVHALNTHIYPASNLDNILKRNPTGVYHHSANNVGCVDEDVHLEPCCSDSSSAADSSSRNAASDRQYSSCAELRASQFSPEACSNDTLVEWLPRIHTAVFPYIQQFDDVQELMDILTELTISDDLNLKIRQAMRRETMELTLHNSGKHHVMCLMFYICQLTRCHQT